MRIAVNTRHLISKNLEGVGRYSFETVKRMVLAYPEHTFYFYFDRSFDPSFVIAENVVPIVVSPPARHPFLFILWYELMLPYYFKKHKIDVFYSPDGFCSLLSKVPTVLVTHDLAYIHYPEHIPIKHLLYYRYFVPRFHKRADHIIAVSTYTKEDISKQFNIPPSKITVGYNAFPVREIVESDVFTEYTEGCPYFIYVGSLHPRKNIVGVIKSFNIYKQKYQTNHKLLLIGRYAWKVSEIKKSIASSLFAKEIIQLSGIHDEKVYSFIRQAEALIYISYFEGFGIPVLEAMKLDVPVICSNRSSLPEVAGDAAILVDPDDHHTIADKMYSIVNDESVRIELQKKAKVNLQRFDWQDTADLIFKALQNVLNV